MHRRTCSMATAIFLLSYCIGHGTPNIPQEEYYTYQAKGQKIGYNHVLKLKMPDGSYKISTDAFIRVSVLGSPLDTSIQSTTDLNKSAKPTQSITIIKRTGSTFTIKCKYVKNKAIFTPINGETETIVLPKNTIIDDGSINWLWNPVLANLKIRRSAGIPYFSPLLGTLEYLKFTPGKPVKETINGKTVLCDSWNTTIKDMPVTFILRHDNLSVVSMINNKQNMQLHIAGKSPVSKSGLLAFDMTWKISSPTNIQYPNPAALVSTKMHVEALISGEKPAISTLNTPYQTFKGTITDITIKGTFQIHEYRYRGEHAPIFPYSTLDINKQAKWLRPDQFAQSNDPQIQSLATKLTAKAQNGWEAATQIGKWVNKNIAPAITGATARECLRTKSGDCGPHANLTIALCRAAGIPAKLSGGALYTPMLGGYYIQHYWVLVWMGTKDGWVPIDTTNGDIGVFNPTHLTLWDTASLQSLTVKILNYKEMQSDQEKAAKRQKNANVPIVKSSVKHIENGLATGYKEEYRFVSDGIEIGKQKAALVSQEKGVQNWEYNLDLEAKLEKQSLIIKEKGTLRITPAGNPVGLTLDASVAGTRQLVNITIHGKSAESAVTIATTDKENHETSSQFKRKLRIDPNNFMGLNNNITFISLALRSSERPDGKTIILPMYMGDAMEPFTMQLTPIKTETISYKGYDTNCQVYDVTPIKEKFWVEKETGAIIKVVDDAQNLTILKE